jgi:hypothetical protein
MAEEQLGITRPLPLFSDGAPEDGLQVENLGDDVLIGDPEMDNPEKQEQNSIKIWQK